ncbi:MAG: hypothetical protein F7C38_05050 [Desulfurococcales archaeon]|nr:hypothetical protein [Desulfurococcales archaeon]
MRFWGIVRVLALLAFLGFVIVGLVFAFSPTTFPGTGVDSDAALWHSLALAFMATVSILALLVAVNPERYWAMLLPLGVGKLVSSVSSMAWYARYPTVGALKLNSMVDGAIALVSLALYVVALNKSRRC